MFENLVSNVPVLGNEQLAKGASHPVCIVVKLTCMLFRHMRVQFLVGVHVAATKLTLTRPVPHGLSMALIDMP